MKNGIVKLVLFVFVLVGLTACGKLVGDTERSFVVQTEHCEVTVTLENGASFSGDVKEVKGWPTFYAGGQLVAMQDGDGVELNPLTNSVGEVEVFHNQSEPGFDQVTAYKRSESYSYKNTYTSVCVKQE